ncbi:SNARE-associated protein-like protein [Tasmannia lanceolata]|uniref:SNARE-associated protein-like protein n=1 Tax=Tasmannia lanceolata TaxID=3420 RepID=UPI00406335A7
MLGGDPPSLEESRPLETLEIRGSEISEPSTSSSNDPIESSDALAKAISSMLGSLIRDFDFRAENTVKSQDQLSSSIDRLTRELDQLLEDAPLPFIMQHAAKISGVRKRVSSLNSLLKSIQRRVDNIDRMLSAGLSHEKVKPDIAGQNQH